MFDTVCADCGINVPWNKQFAVIENKKSKEYKIVCEECVLKYDKGENDENR